jgi:glycosyltransferase involved in cell wall biosynthesis
MGLSLSIIIPVHNAQSNLGSCLRDLTESATAYAECIVVDDGSTDRSAETARRFGATVLSTKRRKGPAHARNLAATVAKGDILVFLDSDVCVYPDTLSRILEAFREDPELDALIGSYDDSPECKDFISQYKNLMHCFVHQHSRRRACTFWSGCGAIRRKVFLEHAGFDESYDRPAIEDIELGYRLSMTGRKVILDKDVLVKHLKRWTFWSLLKSDILDRGVPWTELILRDRCMPNDLNLELSQRVSVALAFVLMAVAAAGVIYWGGYFLTPLVAVLFFLMARYWAESASHRHSKYAAVLVTLGIGAFAWLAHLYAMDSIVPLLVLAYLLLFLRHRYAYVGERRRKLTGMMLGAYIIGSIGFMATYLPSHILVIVFFLLAATIVILNNQFYLFLAAKQGRLFALAAIPFHLLYHLYNGISFAVGLAHYTWRRMLRREPQSGQPHPKLKRAEGISSDSFAGRSRSASTGHG